MFRRCSVKIPTFNKWCRIKRARAPEFNQPTNHKQGKWRPDLTVNSLGGLCVDDFSHLSVGMQ